MSDVATGELHNTVKARLRRIGKRYTHQRRRLVEIPD